ncbi:hypothetical protein DPEC_G00017650 [Dallia pectoralis]|uniref:Uncharacterized protein n=1 Tax=Dallia pectoralis TaxID=75939 RepID=A0ACC2HFK2_DALPE|nr:hypothetical protein DPEC_G00017650 [Dallia pectoralis]
MVKYRVKGYLGGVRRRKAREKRASFNHHNKALQRLSLLQLEGFEVARELSETKEHLATLYREEQKKSQYRLYNTKPADGDLATAFLEGLNRVIEGGESEDPEMNIEELIRAVHSINKQKAPGPDPGRVLPDLLGSHQRGSGGGLPSHIQGEKVGIMTKALTKRFQSHLPTVIAADQTCSIPERSINDNLLLVRDVILHSQVCGSPLGLLSLDQEKAFDRIRRETRIRTSPGIPGNQLPGAGGEALRVVAYMDDITIIGTDSHSITTATKAVDDYCAATGALVNRGRVFPPDKATSKKIERLMFTFVWGSQMERLQRSTLYKMVENGGKGVPDILNIIRAQQLSNLVKTFNKPDRKASFFEKHYATPILRTLGMGTIDHTVPYSWDPPKVYKAIKEFAVGSVCSWAGVLEIQRHHGPHRLQGHSGPSESQLNCSPATGMVKRQSPLPSKQTERHLLDGCSLGVLIRPAE